MRSFMICTDQYIVLRRLRLKWAGHVARMANKRNTYTLLWKNLKAIDRLEDLGAEKMGLKWLLRKQNATEMNGLFFLWIGATGRLL